MQTIHISPERTLETIANEFNEKFPFLQLAFFSHTHASDQLSPATEKLDLTLTIEEASPMEHIEEMSIHGNLKVSSLEQHFQEAYGIGLQVLRRSGQLWLQTSTTDDWTLGKQNQEGEEDSMPVE